MGGRSTYLIIGSGKTATHLSHYFKLLHIPYKNWSRKSAEPIPAADKILLAISDSAIENFVQENLAHFKGPIIHFSGANEFPGLISAHPLVSFGPDLYTLDLYKKIPFILTSGKLQDFIPKLENPSFTITAGEKPYYHALCVLSGNFTTLLWQKLFNGLNDLSIPATAAIPYLESIVQNLKQNPNQALTGPLIRKDSNTVAKNLKSLDQDPYQNIYKAFQKVVFPEFTA